MSSAQRQDYLVSSRERHLAELFELLRIPSISAHASAKPELDRCAQWLLEKMEAAGLNAEISPTKGLPVVYGERLVDPSLPTVLIYGHYDVQPPDPLELWTSPPFEPEVRNGNIYARGATDDKGQMFCYIKALETLQREPEILDRINIKMIVEGEEEVGSQSLRPWLEANRERLKCDVVLISDSSMHAPGVPAIMVGLRGLAYLEVTVRGPSHDLHSGLYGGAVPNPIHGLSKMIASLHDDQGRITIPGFYDKVRDLTSEERDTQRLLSPDIDAFLQETGSREVVGEAGYCIEERTTSRPTLELNGIWGGYIGEGSKTVLPSLAHAKISCRLVPDQEPDAIAKLVGEHLVAIAPPGFEVTYSLHHGGRPYLASGSQAVDLVLEALSDVWGAKGVKTRGGGSIPIVADFKDVLGADSILMGLGLNDDRLHSPDEKFGLENFYKGIEGCAAALTALANNEWR